MTWHENEMKMKWHEWMSEWNEMRRHATKWYGVKLQLYEISKSHGMKLLEM